MFAQNNSRNWTKTMGPSANNKEDLHMAEQEFRYVIRAEGRADILALREFRASVLSMMDTSENPGAEAFFLRRGIGLKGRRISDVSRIHMSIRESGQTCASFTVRTKTIAKTRTQVQVNLLLKSPNHGTNRG